VLAAVIFGWPAVFTSLGFLAAGIVTGRSRVGLVGALVACPFLLYVSGAPRLRWFALACALLLFASVVTIARQRRWAAALLAAPYVGLCGYVAHLVLNQAG
jgi:hypothetical protein